MAQALEPPGRHLGYKARLVWPHPGVLTTHAVEKFPKKFPPTATWLGRRHSAAGHLTSPCQHSRSPHGVREGATRHERSGPTPAAHAWRWIAPRLRISRTTEQAPEFRLPAESAGRGPPGCRMAERNPEIGLFIRIIATHEWRFPNLLAGSRRPEISESPGAFWNFVTADGRGSRAYGARSRLASLHSPKDLTRTYAECILNAAGNAGRESREGGVVWGPGPLSGSRVRLPTHRNGRR